MSKLYLLLQAANACETDEGGQPGPQQETVYILDEGPAGDGKNVYRAITGADEEALKAAQAAGTTIQTLKTGGDHYYGGGGPATDPQLGRYDLGFGGSQLLDYPNLIQTPRRSKKPKHMIYQPGSLPKRRREGGGRCLWEFLLALLNSNHFNPKIIKWVDKKSFVFKMIDARTCARLWGLQKGKFNMGYESLARALRYYYDIGVMRKVAGQRLMYQFTEEYWTTILEYKESEHNEPLGVRVVDYYGDGGVNDAYQHMYMPHSAPGHHQRVQFDSMHGMAGGGVLVDEAEIYAEGEEVIDDSTAGGGLVMDDGSFLDTGAMASSSTTDVSGLGMATPTYARVAHSRPGGPAYATLPPISSMTPAGRAAAAAGSSGGRTIFVSRDGSKVVKRATLPTTATAIVGGRPVQVLQAASLGGADGGMEMAAGGRIQVVGGSPGRSSSTYQIVRQDVAADTTSKLPIAYRTSAESLTTTPSKVSAATTSSSSTASDEQVMEACDTTTVVGSDGETITITTLETSAPPEVAAEEETTTGGVEEEAGVEEENELVTAASPPLPKKMKPGPPSPSVSTRPKRARTAPKRD